MSVALKYPQPCSKSDNSVLASWDGEEYGLLGSTEWVEEYIDPWLSKTAISYLNIDVGTAGPHPDISATPELHTIAIDIMKKVLFPQGGALNETLYNIWLKETGGEVGVLGSGSDYTAFVHKGIGAVSVFGNVPDLLVLGNDTNSCIYSSTWELGLAPLILYTITTPITIVIIGW